MNIKAAEELSGVSRQNIRFYEREGLLNPDRNPENDYREYQQEHIETLKMIRVMRMLDMPLDQIKLVLEGSISPAKAAKEQRQKLKAQQEQLSAAIRFCEEWSAFQTMEAVNVDEMISRMESSENVQGLFQKWVEDYRKVVLVDTTAVKNLFGGENPVGECIELCGDVFTVVGVVDLSESFAPTINSINDYWLYANTSSGTIYLPSAVWPTAYQFDEPQNVAIKVANTDDMASVGKEAADLLTEKQIIDKESDVDYRSQDMLEQAQQLQSMSESTNMQLVWIASISLIVGGIGVMNIMLVSVTERTSEIGLKKALGAKKRRIRMQFLTEAAVLTSLGGIIGVASGIGLAELISNMLQLAVSVSVPAIVIAVGFSTVIGIVFGLVPAIKAANLNPIEALRRN